MIKMVFHHFFYIVLIFFFVPGLSMKRCTINYVTQPKEHVHGRVNQTVFIYCHVNISCQIQEDVQWYVFKTDSYDQLDINKQPTKYTLQDAGLHINSLSHRDDGVYHCAVSDRGSTASGAQAIGTGTTLTVKENDYNAGEVLLITLVVLLSLYSLIILTLFICIKTGRAMLIKQKQSQSQEKGDSTRRVHFGAVVQELYSKRNLQRNKKNTSTDISHENKVEEPQSHTVREDIYQNLKRAR